MLTVEIVIEMQDRATGLYIACGNLMEDSRFHLSASVYTEITDVESEINGWVTYDRKVGYHTKLFFQLDDISVLMAGQNLRALPSLCSPLAVAFRLLAVSLVQ